MTPKGPKPRRPQSRRASRSTRPRRSAEKRRQPPALLLAAERAARRKAEKAGRLKDDFLATLAHQLRNPLNAILGWAYLLRDQRLDAESTARGLDTICRNAELQGRLISSVLEAAELIAGPLHFDAEPVDIGSLLANVLDSVKPVAEARQLRVEAKRAPGAVAGDSSRLRQAFWSLLSGAAGAAAPGSTLEVAVESSGSAVEVSIRQLEGRSAGASAAPPQLETSGEEGVSGWRLRFAVARYFVELHGGSIETAPTHGGPTAAVRIRLPASGRQSDRRNC